MKVALTTPSRSNRFLLPKLPSFFLLGAFIIPAPAAAARTAAAWELGTVFELQGEPSLRGQQRFLDDRGVSESDLKCALDTNDLLKDSPELKDITDQAVDAMNINMNEAQMKIDVGFPDDYIEKLKTACDDAGGYFITLQETDFICDNLGGEVKVELKSFVNCVADTTECRNTDEIKLLESLWEAYDLDCRVEGEERPTSGTSKPYTSTYTPPQGDEDASMAFAGAVAALLLFFTGLGVLYIVFVRHSIHEDSQRNQGYEMTEGSAELCVEVDATIT